ncbi:hypothetical protein [Yoonia vestfoldensis]|uniref:hypothetical protein n=1 Tax=Yoonia vestfoldensis TaxID=245188 RepID=UPI000369B8FF|nr:hypothetical protein [Yoonia vestfoldensis]
MTETQNMTNDRTTQDGQTTNDPQKLNLRTLRDWLSGDVDIRVPRGWLVAGAAAFAALLIVALD